MAGRTHGFAARSVDGVGGRTVCLHLPARTKGNLPSSYPWVRYAIRGPHICGKTPLKCAMFWKASNLFDEKYGPARRHHGTRQSSFDPAQRPPHSRSAAGPYRRSTVAGCTAHNASFLNIGSSSAYKSHGRCSPTYRAMPRSISAVMPLAGPLIRATREVGFILRVCQGLRGELDKAPIASSEFHPFCRKTNLMPISALRIGAIVLRSM